MIYGMLSAYCLAGCLMEHFAVFSGWPEVGSAQFESVQRAQGHGGGFVYVVPKTALSVWVVLLLAEGPDGIVSWPLWAGSAALTVSWVSSAAIQVPIQPRIRRNADRAAIERLLRTDWIRVAAMAVHFGFAVVVMGSS
jgi:hypothetical protein